MVWSLHRILLLLSGVAFALIGLQVSLFHYRGNFRHWTMWTPVISAPVLAVLLLWQAFIPGRTLALALGALLWVEAGAGLGGFAMHARGVTQRVGGWGMNNVLTGPPVVLPLLLTALSVLGLLALYGRI